MAKCKALTGSVVKGLMQPGFWRDGLKITTYMCINKYQSQHFSTKEQTNLVWGRELRTDELLQVSHRHLSSSSCEVSTVDVALWTTQLADCYCSPSPTTPPAPKCPTSSPHLAAKVEFAPLINITHTHITLRHSNLHDNTDIHSNLHDNTDIHTSKIYTCEVSTHT